METKRLYVVAACIVLGLVIRPAVAAGESEADFLRLLARADSAYAEVRDYTATRDFLPTAGAASGEAAHHPRGRRAERLTLQNRLDNEKVADAFRQPLERPHTPGVHAPRSAPTFVSS